MKLGFVSAILADLDLDGVLEVASSAGFGCVELMCWPKGKAERRYAGVTHIDVDELGPGEVERVQGKLALAGIEISALGYYPNALAPDQAEAAAAASHLKKVIVAARTLGVGVVNTFIGRDWTKSVDENFVRFHQVWPGIVKCAEENGVKIGIENCPMFFSGDEWPGGKNLAHSPAIWRRMFDAIPSGSFGLNYDPSHLVWQQMDYIAPLREFGPKLFHVHAKDAKVDRHRLNDVGIMATPLAYHSPKLPGLGDIEWGSFFSALGDTGYTGPVVIEVEDRAYEATLESRKQALRQSKRFLENWVTE